MTKYTPKSESDNTDDWPFWMVWDGQNNVTIKALCSFMGMPEGSIVGMPFVTRKRAEMLADHMNDAKLGGRRRPVRHVVLTRYNFTHEHRRLAALFNRGDTNGFQ